MPPKSPSSGAHQPLLQRPPRPQLGLQPPYPSCPVSSLLTRSLPPPHSSPAFCPLLTLLHPQEAYESAKQRAAEAAEGAKATAGELGGSAERAAREAAGTTEGAAREAGGAAREGLAGAEGAVKEAGQKMEVRWVQ